MQTNQCHLPVCLDLDRRYASTGPNIESTLHRGLRWRCTSGGAAADDEHVQWRRTAAGMRESTEGERPREMRELTKGDRLRRRLPVQGPPLF